jgi:hypothetical protein
MSSRKSWGPWCALAMALCCASLVAHAAERLAIGDVPAPLAPWVSWVLDDVPERDCPLYFNSDQRRCAWSSPLHLELDARGGGFATTVSVHARSWVALPGGDGQWPQGVTVDGSDAVVVAHAGRPAVLLASGRHRLAGRFEWRALPETLHLPADTGVVEVKIEGVAQPRVSAVGNGELWLKPRGDAVSGGDSVEARVFRQLVDELPMTVETVLELDVSGAAREWQSRGMLLEGAVPMQLTSPLPARLEVDGTLRLQLRSGHWRVVLRSRQAAPTAHLAPPTAAAPWPAEEVWAFAARNALRLVEVRGGTVVDPLQTNAPAEWRELPTWRMAQGDALEFVEQRRGDPQPEPDQLRLVRDLWLDFDGQGYTVQDHMSGQMTRRWRLDASPDLQIGRVTLNGEPQFITAVDARTRGVEVRRGALELTADARVARGEMAAVGWMADVQQLSTRLHLPPGWRLWSASGADNVPDTWLKRWTLLDLFVVLIIAIATARLMGGATAVLVLVSLALIWHEARAPHQPWLHLLAAQALLSVLPEHLFKRLVRAYRNVTLVVLLVMCLDFMMLELRVGLFPQLAQVQGMSDTLAPAAPVASDAPQPAAALEAVTNGVASSVTRMERRLAKSMDGGQSADAARSALSDIDPHATIQTGPGLPSWQGHTVELSWNGPVTQAQRLHLSFISPFGNLLLAVARVALLAALLVVFLREALRGLTAPRPLAAQASTLLVLLALTATGVGAPRAAHAAAPDAAVSDDVLPEVVVPDAGVLQQLRERLTRAPDCLPSCASLARLDGELADQHLSLSLDIHAAGAVAVPLPGAADQWSPSMVVVDGDTERGLARDAHGVLWLELAEGRHRIDLLGATPPGASFQLPFPLPPRRLDIKLAGWTVSGQRDDGGAHSQLIFTRIARDSGGVEQTLKPRALPAFFRVERVLHLGLDWRVETRVVRLTPPDSAAVLSIPLLAGESVTSAEARVNDGRIAIDMASGVSEAGWSSVLAQSSPLVFRAPDAPDWVETWRADIAPLWHAELGGLAVVHHQSEAGQWLPTWQPWPGERVTIALTRPRGVEGQSLTVDRSALAVRPAQRASDFTLDVSLRSSKGGQHVMTLPDGARLASVSINGAAQPIRQDGRKLSLPVVPGMQQVTLNWQADEALVALYRVPAFSLGMPSVNASIALGLPQDRWVLWAGGPRVGPAVLFWGVLLVWCLVAVALGRTRVTPLGTAQWLLLVIGLTQIALPMALLVIAWLFALGARERVGERLSRRWFNAMQVVLALLTLVALSTLFQAIEQGLLGQPNMQIAGNGSHGNELKWFADRVADEHPRAWVLSVSLWFYRGLMLAWALWLAFALLAWLRWGWRAYSADGLWRAAPPRIVPPSDSAPGAEVSS